MSSEQMHEILKKYRPSKARLAYLRSQIEMLERFLRKCENESVSDQISLSQAITGMPHGSNPGDPTGRLAMDIASGKITPFVKQIKEEIEQVNGEIAKTKRIINLAEIILSSMSEREREVVEMKIVDDLSWVEILDKMNHQHNNSYSKRSLQRMLSGAMDKAMEVVK